jgi:hypothetical protein
LPQIHLVVQYQPVFGSLTETPFCWLQVAAAAGCALTSRPMPLAMINANAISDLETIPLFRTAVLPDCNPCAAPGRDVEGSL